LHLVAVKGKGSASSSLLRGDFVVSLYLLNGIEPWYGTKSVQKRM